ncbi:MAG: phosphate ABC transporter permease subunit PstC [Pseudomonadota bacterium]
MIALQPATLLLLGAFGAFTLYFLGRRRALSLGASPRGLKSLPAYYGAYAALWLFVPLILALLIWWSFSGRLVALNMLQRIPDSVVAETAGNPGLALDEIRNIANGAIQVDDDVLNTLARDYLALQTESRRRLTFATFALAFAGAVFGLVRIRPGFTARQRVERFIRALLFLASSVAVLTTIGIVATMLLETFRFFGQVPVAEFLFGLEWSPQTAIRNDQVAAAGSFGAVPLLAGTLLVAALAMVIAVPVGLMTAIYLTQYAGRGLRVVVKPMLEVLAGIPTVVYGFFAALTVAPLVRRLGEALGLNVASESALAAGLVVGIMVIPQISSLSDDALTAVPRPLRDGALALGATRSETIRNVLLPAAMPGIVGGILLALSRAIGETMIVVMAAGLAANLTANPFEAVTTMTVQIVALLTGDQELASARTLAAFALGLFLFMVTLALNVLGHRVVRRQQVYER